MDFLFLPALICLGGVLLAAALLLALRGGKAKTAAVTIEDTAGVPLEWVFTIDDPAIVKLAEQKSRYPHPAGYTGGSLYRKYIFQGLCPGETTIRFQRQSISCGQVVETKIFRACVARNRSLTISQLA